MRISVYTTPNCPQCRIVKKMLDEAKVKYETTDLSQDAEAMEMVKGLGYVSAPVVFVGDAHWTGFRHEKMLDTITKYRLAQIHEAA